MRSETVFYSIFHDFAVLKGAAWLIVPIQYTDADASFF